MKFFKSLNKIYWALTISIATYLIFVGKFLLPNYYFWGSDSTFFYYPSRFYLQERILEDKSFPFWTERQFLGFPIYADAENGYLNPINVLSILIFGPDLSYKILHFVFYLIGSLSFYLFLKRKQINLLGFFVANSIYYFSTYLLNHQIHFNIILTFYLFPAGILLTDLFIEKTKVRFLLLLSIILSFGVLYGHLQSSLIFSFGVFLYYLVFNFKNFISFKTLFFGISMIFLIGIQTFHQILPSYEVYKKSERDQTIDLYKGSFVPIMTSFSFVPYVLGNSENYLGLKIKQDFSYTELYIYSGISTFIIFCFTFIFTKTTKISWYSYILIWIFLVLSTLKYSQFFNQDTPLISLFRYWERIYILSIFGISFLIAKFVSNPFDLNFEGIKGKVLLLLLPTFFITYLQLNISSNIEISKAILNTYSQYVSLSNEYFLPFFIICILTIFLLILLLTFDKFKIFLRFKYIFKIALVLFILIDLYYFSFDVVNYRLQDISNYKINDQISNQDHRSLLVNHSLLGLENLRYKTWNLFGYSQFLEKDYKDFLVKNGILDTYGRVGLPIDENQAREFGITQIFINNEKGENEVVKINYEGSDLIKNKIETKFLKRKSGHIIFSYNSAEDMLIKTRIKYSKNWEVKINGEAVDYSRDGIFFEFNAPKGENLVEITYVPKDFYLGLKISGILFLVFLFQLYILKKKNLYNNA